MLTLALVAWDLTVVGMDGKTDRNLVHLRQRLGNMPCFVQVPFPLHISLRGERRGV